MQEGAFSGKDEGGPPHSKDAVPFLECGSPLPLFPQASHAARVTRRCIDRLSWEFPKSGGGPPHSKGAAFWSAAALCRFPPGIPCGTGNSEMDRSVVLRIPQKRWRATALQRCRILECGSPLPLFPQASRAARVTRRRARNALGFIFLVARIVFRARIP